LAGGSVATSADEHEALRQRHRALPVGCGVDREARDMNTWIYVATSRKASLPATLESVLNLQLLWRSAHNANGALIAKTEHRRFSHPS
jgi:hypothetical protein